MEVFRTRLAALLTACLIGVAFTACGDDDEKGAAEEIEKGVEKGAKKAEKEGKELEDDVKGTDEKKQDGERLLARELAGAREHRVHHPRVRRPVNVFCWLGW